MSTSVQNILLQLGQANFSQTEISRRTNIPQPRLSRWMNGEVANSADDALKLLALLESVREQSTPNKEGVGNE
jgi:predicted XRE-type DNA-binding protein